MSEAAPIAPSAMAPQSQPSYSLGAPSTEDKAMLNMPALRQAHVPMKAKKRNVWAMLLAVIGFAALLALLLWWLLA